MDTPINSAMAAFKEFLAANEWCFLEDNEVYRGLTGGSSGQWHWLAHMSGNQLFLVFHAYCPLNVPARRRPAVAEYLMRANWGMHFGNFEMDWSDGQVGFRTSIPADGPELSAEAMSHLVFVNGHTMNRYLPGLIAVACGNVSPLKAVIEAEKDLPAPPQASDAANGDASGTNASGADAHPPHPQARRFSLGDN